MGTFWILVSLIIFVCILLVLVVMVQNPKGGGLSSSFGGGGTQQVGGVKKTSDFLDKSTWALATLLLALILLSNVAIEGPNNSQESKALDLDAAPTTSQPAAVPVQETTTDESLTPEATDSE